MEIMINGKRACLDKDCTIEYVRENRLLTGTDDYSFEIELPMRDCVENIAIFGHINRHDVYTEKIIMDCVIRDINFYKKGSITVIEITESSVKIQFFEGRSASNFNDSWDKVYIDEIHIDTMPSSVNNIYPDEVWNPESVYCNGRYVALPYVDNNDGRLRNAAYYDTSINRFNWISDSENENYTGFFTCQPYLLHVTKKICDYLGYSYNFQKWQLSKLRWLLICNVVPGNNKIENVLPHWTVEEFFSYLEDFLFCHFDIDHSLKSVNMNFIDRISSDAGKIAIDNVVDEFSREIKDEEDKISTRCVDYQNFKYSDCSHRKWKYYSCQDVIDACRKRGIIQEYNTLDDLLAATSGYKAFVTGQSPRGATEWYGSDSEVMAPRKLYYVKDTDTYFALETYDTDTMTIGNTEVPIYYNRLVTLNSFGPKEVGDDYDDRELKFVPAWIDFAGKDNGDVLFVDYTKQSESDEDEDEVFFKGTPIRLLDADLDGGIYYDKIYIGYWPSSRPTFQYNQLPHPIVDNYFQYSKDVFNWKISYFGDFSLRLNRNVNNMWRSSGYKFNGRVKSTFKFISDNIPDPRAKFLIRGKYYVCEKLTANFSINGMSNLIKGEFYELTE